MVFNTSTEARDDAVAVEVGSAGWRALVSARPVRAAASGIVSESPPARAILFV